MNGLYEEVKQAQQQARRLLDAQGRPFPTYQYMTSTAYYGYSPEVQAAQIIAHSMDRQVRAIEQLVEMGVGQESSEAWQVAHASAYALAHEVRKPVREPARDSTGSYLMVFVMGAAVGVVVVYLLGILLGGG